MRLDQIEQVKMTREQEDLLMERLRPGLLVAIKATLAGASQAGEVLAAIEKPEQQTVRELFRVFVMSPELGEFMSRLLDEMQMASAVLGQMTADKEGGGEGQAEEPKDEGLFVMPKDVGKPQ